MKEILLALTLLLAAAALPARASDWTGKFGNDAGSFGGILIHDFSNNGTDTGLQWDAEHIRYQGDEVAEAGVFVIQRDTDKHVILGPDGGVPGADLGSVAACLHNLVDWNWLTTAQQWGQYAHAYFVFGWDASRIEAAHLRPDLYGLGGVLKFGGSTK